MISNIRSIVITGSTRGIGYYLAAAFLERDCAVTISGRTKPAVDEALTEHRAEYPNSQRNNPCMTDGI